MQTLNGQRKILKATGKKQQTCKGIPMYQVKNFGSEEGVG